MKDSKPTAGIVLTMSDLYRQNIPDLPAEFAGYWRPVIQDILSDYGTLYFTEVAHTADEFAAQVKSCDKAECDLLIILPMAYASSEAVSQTLGVSKLPLVIVNTARDSPLPYDMTDDYLLANQAMHGVQDLANTLWRMGRQFCLIAGHHSQPTFREKLQHCVRAAAGACVLQNGRVGRIGQAFEGMLDFSFDPDNLSKSLGFEIMAIEPKELISLAEKVDRKRTADFLEWMQTRFEVDPDLTDDELSTAAVWALAIDDMVEQYSLDAIAMNFLAVSTAGAHTLPFLGASRLMSRGTGYAGEGDVLTAALVTALARIAGESTFTEMFCPDYERGEVLLSHMGECNFEMANPERAVKLMPKIFAWGECKRLAVPVFQLRPGPVTLVSLTETPEKSFQLVVVTGEIIDAPDHPNLRNPYARIRFNKDLSGFLEQYSRAAGTHHLALTYGDLRDDMAILADLCQIGCKSL